MQILSLQFIVSTSVISSGERVKSKMSMFSGSLFGLLVFGMTTVPSCTWKRSRDQYSSGFPYALLRRGRYQVSEDNLSRGFFLRLGYFLNGRMFRHLGKSRSFGRSSSAQRTVACDDDFSLLAEFDQVFLVQVRVHLHLVGDRKNSRICHDSVQLGRVEVWDSNGSGQAQIDTFFHFLPGVQVVGVARYDETFRISWEIFWVVLKETKP